MQVSLLGRGQSRRFGKLGYFLRAHRVMLVVLAWVLGPGLASAEPLDAGSAMDVYRTVDGWVRQWDVGEGGELLPSLACVSVTLRLDGQVIGRGQMAGFDADPLRLEQAARGAMAEARAWARQKMGDEPSDELWGSIGSRLTLSVELADRVVPMSDSELGQPGMGLSPGVHGVVMRLGEKIEVMSPDEMITLGIDAQRGAYSMATALSQDGGMALASVAELLERGYDFGRFEPVWIAQQGAGMGGVFLDRGGRVVDGAAVGVRSIHGMGERIAGYLMAQRWPGAEKYGMVGTRDVVSGRAMPEVAPVYEQAMVAHALLRFSKQGDGAMNIRAREHGMQLLNDLAVVQPGESAPWDDGVGSAACIVAMSSEQIGIRSPEWETMWDRCLETVDGLFSPIDGFTKEVPPAARGLVAWAMVRSRGDDAEYAVRSVFRDTEPGQLAAQMPFLGWAELELAKGKDSVSAGMALNTMREWMWGHQLGKADLDWRDRDFVGGIVFTKGSSVLPTSANLRPIAVVCSMLGDERLTPGTIADGAMASEIGRVASAMRFVDQLVVSEDSGFVSRAPERCVGGVRESLWDWRVSPASSALALLAAIEFEDSIREIGARKLPAPSP